MRQDLESLKRGEQSTGENSASVYVETSVGWRYQDCGISVSVETSVHWRYLDFGKFDANSGRSDGS